MTLAGPQSAATVSQEGAIDPLLRFRLEPYYVRQFAKQMGLTPTQSAAVDEQFARLQKRLGKLNVELDAARGALRSLIDRTDVTAEQFLGQLDQVRDLESQAKREHLVCSLRVRRILTADQLVKVSALTPWPPPPPAAVRRTAKAERMSLFELLERFRIQPIMARIYGQDIGLSEAQRAFVLQQVNELHRAFGTLNPKLEAERDQLRGLIGRPDVTEAQGLALLDRVLDLERQIERGQFTCSARVRNTLTSAQVTKLRELKPPPPPPPPAS
jgi:hypothetical protein